MSIKLKGSTDGSVTLQAPADTSPTGTDKTLTLPTTTGSANQFVKNGGTAGELEYSSMVEDSSGVGIGVSAPGEKLDVNGNIRVGSNQRVMFGPDGFEAGIKYATDATLQIAARSGENIAFTNGQDGTERARLDSSGRFLHGLTSPSSSSLKFEVAANVGPDPAFRFNQTATSGLSYDMFFTKTGYAPDNTSSRFLTCSDSSSDRLIIRSDGDVVNHDNSYGSISDVSKKQQIADAASQWDDIKAVRVRKFKMNSDVEAYGDEAGFRIGVVAQELEQTSPGLVKNGAELDGTTVKTVSYSVLYMKAVKALQEAQTRIETLETQNTAQQAQIDDLLARVTALEAAE